MRKLDRALLTSPILLHNEAACNASSGYTHHIFSKNCKSYQTFYEKSKYEV